MRYIRRYFQHDQSKGEMIPLRLEIRQIANGFVPGAHSHSRRDLKEASYWFLLVLKKVVGAKGFEPSTSWSRTKYLYPINALTGVADGTRSVISPF
jgi:hypothetical protein